MHGDRIQLFFISLIYNCLCFPKQKCQTFGRAIQKNTAQIIGNICYFWQ